MRILSIDLEGISQGKYPQQLTRELTKELLKISNSKNSKKEKSEIHFISGYLDWIEQRYSQAMEHFEQVEQDDPLSILARYLQAALYIEISMQEPQSGINPCVKAQHLFHAIQGSIFFPSIDTQNLELSIEYCFPAQKLAQNQEPDFLRVNQLIANPKLSDFKRKQLLIQTLLFYQKLQRSRNVGTLVDLASKSFEDQPLFLDHVERVTQIGIPRHRENTPQISKKDQKLEDLQQQSKNFIKKGRSDLSISLIVSGATDRSLKEHHTLLMNELKSVVKNTAKTSGLEYKHYKELLRLSEKDLYELGRFLWNQNINSEAHHILLNVTALYPKSKEAEKSHYIMAGLNEDLKIWSQAIFHHRKYLDSVPNTSPDERSRFKLGWLHILNGQQQKGLYWLSLDKKLSESPHTKAQASYWMAQAMKQQDGDKTREREQYEEILNRYPLTFYTLLASDELKGRRVRLESRGIGIDDDDSSDVMKLIRRCFAVGLPMTAHRLYLNFGALLAKKHKLEYTQYQDLAQKHSIAIPQALDLIDLRFDAYGLEKDLVKMFFPLHYFSTIEQQAKNNHVDPFLLTSLIKQESAFEAQAISRADAKGLMQLIYPTAKKVSQDIGIKNFTEDQLLMPEINITLGSKYFSDQIASYGGKVPYALAAYNAGPHRVNTWIERWGDLPMKQFIELIPFQETRSYVKLIFRNYYFYHLLEKGRSPQNTEKLGL